jgi:hypothetical protein
MHSVSGQEEHDNPTDWEEKFVELQDSLRKRVERWRSMGKTYGKQNTLAGDIAERCADELDQLTGGE